jgi:hypothetical protein
MPEFELSEDEKLRLFAKAKKFANKHQGTEPKPNQNPDTWKKKWMRTYIRQVKYLIKQRSAPV